MKSPIETFFSLGDKVTKGNPKRKADFDFYLFLMIFLAFLMIMIDNLIKFYNFGNFTNLGWAIIMLAMLWFQYFGLKGMYEYRKMLNVKVDIKLETEKEMLDGFEKK